MAAASITYDVRPVVLRLTPEWFVRLTGAGAAEQAGATDDEDLHRPSFGPDGARGGRTIQF